MNLENLLNQYKISTQIQGTKAEKTATVKAAKAAFLTEVQTRPAGWFSFLYSQSRFVKKRWWAVQFFVLTALYPLLLKNQDRIIQRMMGIAASMFVLLIVPELWKSRNQTMMEIEGASFYSLRQIYLARLLLFAVFDGILLCGFWGIAIRTTSVSFTDVICQFLLPMIVTCCICLRILCSKFIASEYIAIFLSMLWTAAWSYIAAQDSIYRAISAPLWILICVAAFLYLIYAIFRLMQDCNLYWERNGDKQWN